MCWHMCIHACIHTCILDLGSFLLDLHTYMHLGSWIFLLDLHTYMHLGSWIFCVGSSYIHASWILGLLCWILFVFFHWIFECSVCPSPFWLFFSNFGVDRVA